METFFIILYTIFCILLIVWIVYDVLNLLIKRKTYNAVEAEVCSHERVPRSNSDDQITYKIRLKYFYDNKENFYSTKWSSNCFIPKTGTKRKIYINKNDSSKIFYIETKIFILFILFRIVFLIPLFERLLKE